MYKLENFTVYSKKKPIINNVNCNIIVENEINVIFGDNAVGKTTLLNVLNFTNFDYEGNVYYLGNNIKEFTPNEVNKIRNTQFGILDQDLKLLENLSVMDNLKIAANEVYSEEYYTEILTKVNIRPDLYKEKVKKLSLGQQQRLAIARCILNGNKVLFFDEPTASLDSKNIEDFLTLIHDLKNKDVTIIIIITHDKVFLHMYDDFVEVENTKIIPSYFSEDTNKNIEIENFKRPRQNKKLVKKLSGKMPILTTLLLSAFIICFAIYVLLASIGITLSVEDLETAVLPEEDMIASYITFQDQEQFEKVVKLMDENENIEAIYTIVKYPSSGGYNESGEWYNFSEAPVSQNVTDVYNYMGLNIIKGEYPNDDSKEILIPTNYADKLIEEGVVKGYDEIIGLDVDFNDVSTGVNITYTISGIYEVPYDIKNYQFYVAYETESGKLMSEEEYLNSSTDRTYYDYIYQYFDSHDVYIMSNSAESVSELKVQLRNNMAYVDTDYYEKMKYKTTSSFLSFLLVTGLLILCYAIVVFIISVIGRLILIKSHKKLQVIGYTRKEIVMVNIKQYFKYITIATLIITMPLVLLTSFNIIFILVILTLLIISYISIIVANLTMNRFIK